MEKQAEIKELTKRLYELTNDVKQHFKDGDVLEYHNGSAIIKIVNVKTGECYGLNNDRWTIDTPFSFNEYPHLWQLSTPEKWLEVCTKEAVKRGLVEGAYALFGRDKHKMQIWSNDYNLTKDGFLCVDTDILMKDGIWAEVIKADKTLEELDKEYWIMNIHYKGSSSLDGWIKANPDAYIKAIQNLKK